MKPDRRRWLYLVILGGGLTALTGLWYASPNFEPKAEPAFGGAYIEGVSGQPSRINPLFAAQNDVDNSLVALIFSGLTRLDDQGRAFPDLAETWDVSPDGRVFSFHLRRGLVWHDGSDVTAGDVVFTYQVLRSSALRSPPPLAKLLAAATVTKVDPLTVNIELAQPYAPLPTFLTLGILPEHLLGGITPAGLFDAPFNQRPVGTGPYRLDELSAEKAVLVANPAHNLGQPYVQRIEMRFFRDDGALIAAIRNRQVDGALLNAGLNPSDRLYFERRSDLDLRTLSSGEITFVYLNLRLAIFQDRRVRQALLYAIDRDSLAGVTVGGQAARADSPIPEGSWAFLPLLRRYGSDPATAGLLLDEAGWRLNEKGIRANAGVNLAFTLSTNNDPVRLAVAEELARRWRAIGIQVTVEAGGTTTLVRDLLEPRIFEAALFSYHPDADPDPYPAWHSTQSGTGGRNLGSWSDARADKLLEEARLGATPARRAEIYRDFQEIFAQEAPAIPLYSSIVFYVQKSSLKGVRLRYLEDPASRFWQVQDWYLKTR